MLGIFCVADPSHNKRRATFRFQLGQAVRKRTKQVGDGNKTPVVCRLPFRYLARLGHGGCSIWSYIGGAIAGVAIASLCLRRGSYSTYVLSFAALFFVLVFVFFLVVGAGNLFHRRVSPVFFVCFFSIVVIGFWLVLPSNFWARLLQRRMNFGPR